MAGASAIGLGTALFYDPLLCPKINAGVAAYLAASGMSSVRELTGSLVAGPAEECG
jgi:dihydroorotate dehydrogenase (NAD+) catalytic subunit